MIEGNNGDKVAYRTIQVNGRYIRGFVTPKYGSKATGTSSSTTATGTTSTVLEHKVGDLVQFAGGKHYVSANATSGTTVKAGPAKVTAIASGAKHPYHLVHTDSTSTVYGWVDASTISADSNIGAERVYTVQAGDSLWAIAQRELGNGARWQEISQLNNLASTTIRVGQKLKLPE